MPSHFSMLTKIVKMNFDSPSGGKVRRKSTAEPTMTIHTRAATDEIYSIFNQPLKAETDADGSSDFEDDDYTSAGESTVTGRISAASSDFGDDDTTFHRDVDDEPFDDQTQAGNVVDGEWTEFTDSKHIPEPSMDTQALQSAVSEDHDDMEGDEADTETHTDEQPVRPRFVPQMPEDYNPPSGLYRDPEIMAQNRLPFMTPIVEQTESSFPSMRAARSALSNAKTPSKPMPGIAGSPTAMPEMEDLLLATPSPEGERFSRIPEDVTLSPSAMKARSSPGMPLLSPARQRGPVIEDAQCDPTNKGIREIIVNSLNPPLMSSPGYHIHAGEESHYAPGIQKYMRALSKRPKSGDEASFDTPMLEFEKADRSYIIRRELGAGAYAPVYLAESVDSLGDVSSDTETDSTDQDSRDSQSMDSTKVAKSGASRYGFEAIKMELGPPNPWEFYMIRTAHERLRKSFELSRCADSIVRAHELHVFGKESFLVEDYRGQGTLLDLINIIRNEPTLVHNNGEGGLDECMAMFFTVELFRTVEALHANGVLHGDIKPDNCLVRFDEPSHAPATPSLLGLGDENTDPREVHYSPRGQFGWREKGLTLIDFGRSIDMRAFKPSVQFIADWEPSSHECNEIREKRPWTNQIDLYGVAGTVHVMLFGKYIESVPVRRSEGPTDNNMTRTYRIRETFKRYWEREIWGDVFDLLLNPGAERWAAMEDVQGDENNPTSAPAQPILPILKSMRYLREKMESWLLANAEKKGLSLQIRKLEALFAEKRKRLERS